MRLNFKFTRVPTGSGSLLRMNAPGRGSGVTLDRQDAIVVEMRDRKMARLDYYNNRKQALQAVGLDE